MLYKVSCIASFFLTAHKKNRGQFTQTPFIKWCLSKLSPVFWGMARPERFELPTARFVAEYSLQLSYGRIVLCVAEADYIRWLGPLQAEYGLKST